MGNKGRGVSLPKLQTNLQIESAWSIVAAQLTKRVSPLGSSLEFRFWSDWHRSGKSRGFCTVTLTMDWRDRSWLVRPSTDDVCERFLIKRGGSEKDVNCTFPYEATRVVNLIHCRVIYCTGIPLAVSYSSLPVDDDEMYRRSVWKGSVLLGDCCRLTGVEENILWSSFIHHHHLRVMVINIISSGYRVASSSARFICGRYFFWTGWRIWRWSILIRWGTTVLVKFEWAQLSEWLTDGNLIGMSIKLQHYRSPDVPPRRCLSKLIISGDDYWHPLYANGKVSARAATAN